MKQRIWLPTALLLAACDRSQPPRAIAENDVDAAPAPTTKASAAPTPSSAASPPPIEDVCSADADCGSTMTTLAGKDMCCSGCTNTIGNVGWLTAHKNWCTAHPAPECPPIGCAMAVPNPRCVSGHCVDKH